MTEQTATGQSPVPPRDHNWGLPTKGVIISASPEKQTFVVGEPIKIRVTLRNAGQRALPLLSTDATTTYRLIAIRQPGDTLAPKSPRLLEAESAQDQPGIVTRSVTMLEPNAESVESFNAGELVQLAAGDYQIVVVRKMVSWEDGFLFSNPLRLKIVK